MKNMNKFIVLSYFCWSFSILAASQYSNDFYEKAQQILNSAPALIKQSQAQSPMTYNFKSSIDGQESAVYSGQTFRQVLISDLKEYLAQQKSGFYPGTVDEALASLLSYYDYDYQNLDEAPGVVNGISDFQASAKHINGTAAEIFEGYVYDDLQFSGKQLKNKLAGNDNPLRHGELLGWNKTQFYGQDLTKIDADKQQDGFVEPEDLLMAWLNIAAENMVHGQSFAVNNGSEPAQTVDAATVLPNGIDLVELIEKFLHGAVSFSQAAGDYLSTDLSSTKGLNASDSELYSNDANYTKLAHHWDEAFGYFGAARDYLNYSDGQLNAKVSIDTNADGKISLLNEQNFTWARNSGRFDLTSTAPTTTFSEDLFNAFLQGRQLIHSQPQGYQTYLAALATVAVTEWEKVISATVIHYINATQQEILEYGSSEFVFTDLAKHWSEMKGFALAYQFNPQSRITVDGFKRLHALIGDEPVLPNGSNGVDVNAYLQSLEQARTLLGDVYGFSSENINSW